MSGTDTLTTTGMPDEAPFEPAFTPDTEAPGSVHDAMRRDAEQALVEQGHHDMDSLSQHDRYNVVAKEAGRTVVNSTFM